MSLHSRQYSQVLVQVFHDAENCWIGRSATGSDGASFAHALYQQVEGVAREHGGTGKMEWSLFLHHDPKNRWHPDTRSLTALMDLGVDHIEVGTKSDAVDTKLKSKIDNFISRENRNPGKYLVMLLSGDKDFMAQLQRLQRAGFKTVVCYNGEASVAKVMKLQANTHGDCVDWSQLRAASGGHQDDESLRAAGWKPSGALRPGGVGGGRKMLYPAAGSLRATDQFSPRFPHCSGTTAHQPPPLPQQRHDNGTRGGWHHHSADDDADDGNESDSSTASSAFSTVSSNPADGAGFSRAPMQRDWANVRNGGGGTVAASPRAMHLSTRGHRFGGINQPLPAGTSSRRKLQLAPRTVGASATACRPVLLDKPAAACLPEPAEPLRVECKLAAEKLLKHAAVKEQAQSSRDHEQYEAELAVTSAELAHERSVTSCKPTLATSMPWLEAADDEIMSAVSPDVSTLHSFSTDGTNYHDGSSGRRLGAVRFMSRGKAAAAATTRRGVSRVVSAAASRKQRVLSLRPHEPDESQIGRPEMQQPTAGVTPPPRSRTPKRKQQPSGELTSVSASRSWSAADLSEQRQKAEEKAMEAADMSPMRHPSAATSPSAYEKHKLTLSAAVGLVKEQLGLGQGLGLMAAVHAAYQALQLEDQPQANAKQKVALLCAQLDIATGW
jgi:hypothetical protein